MELEKRYRLMLLKVVRELTYEDCVQIAFAANLPTPTCQPEPGKPSISLHLMSTLESLGQIGPLNVEFLEEMLEAIGKEFLLEITEDYKKRSVYKEAKKKLEEQEKKKKRGKKCKSQIQADPTLEYSTEAQELLSFKPSPTDKKKKLQKIYTTLLTQVSQVTLLLRSALECDDPNQMEETFLVVASDGEAITKTLRKNLSVAGIKCSSDSSSSDSSGEPI